MSRILAVSLGKKTDLAVVTRTWRGTFAALVAQLLAKVQDTTDKGAAGWVCGAEFSPEYRHSDNFAARHLVSLDYDHIQPEDVDKILGALKGTAYLAYTTWSHVSDHPRIRVWVPLSRAVDREEFEATSRRLAAKAGIELAARESHVPAQFMWRPCSQAGIPFQSWIDTESPYLDVDKVLAEYWDWRDHKEWPRCKERDECHNTDTKRITPLDKPGIIGLFNRTFTITDAIARFNLPYRR